MSKKTNICCLGCGFGKAYLVMDFRYNGLRGNCPNCGGNWPES
ncbi:hypothetical protein [Nitrosopumilus adriaticus]|nr:hypothetical protein [Nitrosopumilus adriaticus]